ncbi:MAG: CRTAC1 family protein [Isosphaeraceae bacterium]
MQWASRPPSGGFSWKVLAGLILAAAAGIVLMMRTPDPLEAQAAKKGTVAVARPVAAGDVAPEAKVPRGRVYQSRRLMDTSGFSEILSFLRWAPDASLEEIRANWQTAAPRAMEFYDKFLPPPGKSDSQRLGILLSKVNVFNFLGETPKAYQLLEQTRSWVESNDTLAEFGLYTVIYYQGVEALRRGENENCIMCRGESSCILPIVPAAVHTNPAGSRLAIKHFTEYLEKFPDDMSVRWLLNLAHMTLGEYPQKVDPRFLIPIDHYLKSEFDIGKFRDISDLAKIERFNMNGGAILEDFDDDGRLDLAVTSSDPAQPMGYYRNAGDGTFEDQTERAGLISQLGVYSLKQTDYNNDGRMDLFLSRGAFLLLPMPQALMRNDGDGKFTDVTEQAGLDIPLNSTATCWADYDNDGRIDVLFLCEKQSNLLYHNKGDGTFEDMTDRAGLRQDPNRYCKGGDWIDYDNDDYPDLFIDNMQGEARLYHNNRDGTFTDVSKAMGIDGPTQGFSCWAWDYDNDGWLDIFATCYQPSLPDVINGMIGKPHTRLSNRLFRNVNGKTFENKTKEAGLDLVFATMGCNFGDYDNDGFLDFYLGTGAPDLTSLVPNRMFKNVDGRRFADITASSGTGNLQKGHGVSCGDWDRDGDIDVFAQMGGTMPGDRYHNLLFQNPGQGNHWLTVKLVGKKTNRAAMGARIKVVTAGEKPATVHRHVSSGSSWGANPLEQHIGLGKARKVATLEIHWPTSGTTQVFRDVDADQVIEVTEFATDYRKLNWKPIPAPR